jgi:tripartite-type tricarboxylate transporter receptor subunit TctC
MKLQRTCLLTTALIAAALGGPAMAEDAAAFYKGKTVTFYTPGSPGGGYDTYMREMIPHLAKRTGATFVPVNEPGGGHLLAVNKTYTSDPDGLTVLLTDGEASLVGQLLEIPGARFDLLKMSWIGRVNGEKRMLLFTNSSPYKTFKEAVEGSETLKVGITGKADAVGLATTMMAHALDMKVNLITGYKGSREFVRAALQGEVNAIVLTESSSKRFSQGGKLSPVAALSRERSALFPDTPTVFEQLQISDTQAWYFDYHEAFAEIGRSMLTSPGVPAERVAYLREVFGEILTDPAFVKAMGEKKRPISYLDAAGLDKAAQAVLGSVSGEQKKAIRHIILEKYYE